MHQKVKFCITFASAPGSGKTPIASFLSWNLNLPVFNNDAIRKEVMEDMQGWHQPDKINEYEKRRDERLQKLIDNGISFIYDASMDRNWTNLQSRLIKAGYSYFVISLDLSRELLEQFYTAKNYTQPLGPSIKEHDDFLQYHSADIKFHITDREFPNRLELSLKKVKDWLFIRLRRKPSA